MDHTHAHASTRAARPSDGHLKTRSHVPKMQEVGLMGFDSDLDSTIDSLKSVMAQSQRETARKHGRSRYDDIVAAAKRAPYTQAPLHFAEPPSSTGSHGTITASSIHLDSNENTSTSTPSSALSGGPDAESTRASVFYQQQQQQQQRRRHRVLKSTGRFGGGSTGGEEGKRGEDILSGVVNTSALFRTFKEWRPDDATDLSIFEDGDSGRAFSGVDSEEANRNPATAESTTNLNGVLNTLAQYNKENNLPSFKSSPLRPAKATAPQRSPRAGPLADAPARINRVAMQATVQNESDMSLVVTTTTRKQQQPQQKSSNPESAPASRVSTLRKTSVAPATAPAGVKSTARAASTSKPQQQQQQQQQKKKKYVQYIPPTDDDNTSLETSAGSREDIDLGIQTMATVDQQQESAVAAAETDNHDAVTNHSFIVPSKSYPLLHNLVTGTLRFTPGAFVYNGIHQHKNKLPAGPLPEDEKEIFVDIDKIREEVQGLQEYNEMLQGEIQQGEIKFSKLLERFYSVVGKTTDGEFVSDRRGESHEHNQHLQNRIRELEAALDMVHTEYEEKARSVADLAAQRDADAAQAASAIDRSKQLQADLDAAHQKLATTARRPTQEAQRRIQQLEQMVAERERVIKALKDERDAANSSHREECRLHRERIARMEAEKSMLSGDHAKCQEDKQTLVAAKDKIARKNAALRELVQAERQGRQTRETKFHTVVDQHRTQIGRLQQLLKEKEASVRQLDDAFRRLRGSWLAKDDTLLRMQGAETAAADVNGLEHDLDDNGSVVSRQDDLEHDNHSHGETAAPRQMEESDGASLSGQSAFDDSMDENMTSAFIIPDIDFKTQEAEDAEDSEATVDGPEVQPKVMPAVTRSSQPRSVTFQDDTKRSAATAACKHSRVNCVVCCQKTGPVASNEKVRVAVPRPVPARGAPLAAMRSGRQRLQMGDMDPGSALAYVMKLLDDERRHLWMEIQAQRQAGAAFEGEDDNDEMEAGAHGAPRPRQALRETDNLWRAYVLKVEQLNRLDDVLEGQRRTGQDMTREEFDVTITQIVGEVCA